MELQNAGDYERHVVVLWGAGGENIGGSQNVRDHLHRGQIGGSAGGGNQGVLTPFFLGGILRFAHAVGVEQQEIARGELYFRLFVLRGTEQSNGRAAQFEADHVIPAQQHGRIVAAVDKARRTAANAPQIRELAEMYW